MPGRLLGGEPGVERRDDLALLGHLVRPESAGDGQRLGVVGQDLVRVAAPSGGFGHLTSMGWTPSVQSECVCRSPRRSSMRDQAGRRPASAASISPASSRSSGSMNGRPEERVGLGLGRERPQLGGVAGQRLALLVDAQEALLGEAPAVVTGHRPQSDVVLLGAREVDAVRAGLARAA